MDLDTWSRHIAAMLLIAGISYITGYSFMTVFTVVMMLIVEEKLELVRNQIARRNETAAREIPDCADGSSEL